MAVDPPRGAKTGTLFPLLLPLNREKEGGKPIVQTNQLDQDAVERGGNDARASARHHVPETVPRGGAEDAIFLERHGREALVPCGHVVDSRLQRLDAAREARVSGGPGHQPGNGFHALGGPPSSPSQGVISMLAMARTGPP